MLRGDAVRADPLSREGAGDADRADDVHEVHAPSHAVRVAPHPRARGNRHHLGAEVHIGT